MKPPTAQTCVTTHTYVYPNDASHLPILAERHTDPPLKPIALHTRPEAQRALCVLPENYHTRRRLVVNGQKTGLPSHSYPDCPRTVSIVAEHSLDAAHKTCLRVSCTFLPFER
nr:hypothetical protein L203_02971 [Cryptococcus depauperatus CBS 7841]